MFLSLRKLCEKGRRRVHGGRGQPKAVVLQNIDYVEVVNVLTSRAGFSRPSHGDLNEVSHDDRDLDDADATPGQLPVPRPAVAPKGKAPLKAFLSEVDDPALPGAPGRPRWPSWRHWSTL